MVIIMFPKKYEQNISRALDSVTNLLIRYFTGIVSESGIMTVLVTVGLLIFGFSWHDALIIAMFVGVLNVIPYLGPIIGIAIGIFIGVVDSTSDLSVFALMLRIAGTILFAQGVDNFLYPAAVALFEPGEGPSARDFPRQPDCREHGRVLGMLLAIPAAM